MPRHCSHPSPLRPSHLVDASIADTTSHPSGLYSNIRWYVWHLRPAAHHETHMSHRLFPTMSTTRETLYATQPRYSPPVTKREPLYSKHSTQRNHPPSLYLPQPIFSAPNDSTLDLGFAPSRPTVIPDVFMTSLTQEYRDPLQAASIVLTGSDQSLNSNVPCGENIQHVT